MNESGLRNEEPKTDGISDIHDKKFKKVLTINIILVLVHFIVTKIILAFENYYYYQFTKLNFVTPRFSDSVVENFFRFSFWELLVLVLILATVLTLTSLWFVGYKKIAGLIFLLLVMYLIFSFIGVYDAYKNEKERYLDESHVEDLGYKNYSL